MGTSSNSNGIPSNNSYIQWSDTNMMKGNRLVLNDMYNFYSDNPIIKDFFDKKVLDLLKEPTGNTGITYQEVSKESILANESTVNLKKTFSRSQ
jgi:hypothetical protein